MIHTGIPYSEKPMGRFAVDMIVINNRDRILATAGVFPHDQVRTAQVQGVVDTGAA